ncbi:hypothetical protein AURDEDRAFT_177183 [Auricularia subglabra TFB-10046 SS5]|uniref:VPS8-like TPR-like repeats domain-containing protein n=1 Tax=Auricularia subglabra (strain TFB-10046 / SS5) TaxID=717982 RepID=J0CTT2_AURST|nr:hypothetical protein AURDEDRAFT_177183 [Auricularia subglabra TFB-10046 SS5]
MHQVLERNKYHTGIEAPWSNTRVESHASFLLPEQRDFKANDLDVEDNEKKVLTLNADVWLHVLRSQLDTVRIVSSSPSLIADPADDMNDQDHPVPTFMRILVQYTFSDLLSHSRSKVSLSRLFKRLVARSASKTIT